VIQPLQCLLAKTVDKEYVFDIEDDGGSGPQVASNRQQFLNPQADKPSFQNKR
jgi:hypothetical protein